MIRTIILTACLAMPAASSSNAAVLSAAHHLRSHAAQVVRRWGRSSGIIAPQPICAPTQLSRSSQQSVTVQVAGAALKFVWVFFILPKPLGFLAPHHSPPVAVLA